MAETRRSFLSLLGLGATTAVLKSIKILGNAGDLSLEKTSLIKEWSSEGSKEDILSPSIGSGVKTVEDLANISYQEFSAIIINTFKKQEYKLAQNISDHNPLLSRLTKK